MGFWNKFLQVIGVAAKYAAPVIKKEVSPAIGEAVEVGGEVAEEIANDHQQAASNAPKEGKDETKK